MQITRVEVTPLELRLRRPVRMAGSGPVEGVTAIFVRLETRDGRSAWGCTVASPELTAEQPGDVLHACRECAALIPDLHPTNIEYSLNMLSSRVPITASTLCAYDLAFHDLLGQAAGMPLYRLLGGYRSSIPTSVTIPLGTLDDGLEIALDRASKGFRMLKGKGGLDPAEDVRRVRALKTALPEHTIRLDADGGYSVRDALDVANALKGVLETFEQPVPAYDLTGLRQVTEMSPVPVLADQSLRDPSSALELAAGRMVDGLSIKLATCGGLRCGQQIDSIARAARMSTMVSCYVEPALLISAGLALALSSPNVRYGDLDGSFDLVDDPSVVGFTVQDGMMTAADVIGLGYSVNLG